MLERGGIFFWVFIVIGVVVGATPNQTPCTAATSNTNCRKGSRKGLYESIFGSGVRIPRNVVKEVQNAVNTLPNGVKNVSCSILGKITGLGKPNAHVIHTKRASAIAFGHTIISAPTKVLEFAVSERTVLDRTGIEVANKMLSDIQAINQRTHFVTIKAWDFEGTDLIVLTYPSGLVSVISDSMDAVMHLVFKRKDSMEEKAKSALAWTIYVSLQQIVRAFKVGVKAMGDCWPLAEQSIAINDDLIKGIKTTPGQVCGLDQLSPVYEVNVTRNDDEFLIIEMPYKVPELGISFEGITVGEIFNNQPLNVSTKSEKLHAEITFRAGRNLKFYEFCIQIVENSHKGVTRHLRLAMDKTKLSQGVSGVIGALITNEINQKLEEVGAATNKVLAGEIIENALHKVRLGQPRIARKRLKYSKQRKLRNEVP